MLATELDTGVSVFIISEETWKTTFHSMSLSLEPSMAQLKNYSGEDLANDWLEYSMGLKWTTYC